MLKVCDLVITAAVGVKQGREHLRSLLTVMARQVLCGDRTAGNLMPGLPSGLVWAALQQDAIMMQLPARAGHWQASCCAAGLPLRYGQEGVPWHRRRSQSI
jgi:hypothetical protein